uniref:Uncharacterized protein n=1 Tax=Siphoviridae sp. ctdYc1 TaxID=2826399 RepID=A0A8S5N1A6_9CAUD|nr:MAG TPA: hypothetical protein [Siphoviridae sp. ctdYc1]
MGRQDGWYSSWYVRPMMTQRSHIPKDKHPQRGDRLRQTSTATPPWADRLGHMVHSMGNRR